MKEYLKIYIDKLMSYVPVAIFVFTIVFYINVAPIVGDLKAEYGADAIDKFMELFSFYLFRTFILSLFIPLYDVVLSNDKLSYIKAMIIHYLLITLTVGVVFYQPGSPVRAALMTVGLCTVIYVVVRIIIYFRVKQFVNDANRIFMENKNSN